jgi:hypothetical protein
MNKEKLDRVIKLLHAAGYQETVRQYGGSLEAVPEYLKADNGLDQAPPTQARKTA